MFLLFAVALFSIDPSVLVDCRGGLGQATLTWQSAGPRPVQVRVGGPNGTALTGWEGPDGSAMTGYWVSNGTVFSLVADSGAQLGSVVARVRCGYTSSGVDAVFTTGPYLPLQPGNQWTYRVNSRLFTGGYITWTVGGTQEVNGFTYSVVHRGPADDWLVRVDGTGRIYQLGEGGKEQLWLDPAGTDPSAILQVAGRREYASPLGVFPDALICQRSASLALERGYLVRGLGLASSQTDLLAGSSGGFFQSYELAEARIDGRLILKRPAVEVRLEAERTWLDVTNHQVSNCEVSCYFVACGLVPGVDPAGTWKPCLEVRVHAEDRSVELTLEDLGGTVLRRAAIPGGRGYYSMPLYSEPNRAYPPGEYRLRATGSEMGGAASLPLKIE